MNSPQLGFVISPAFNQDIQPPTFNVVTQVQIYHFTQYSPFVLLILNILFIPLSCFLLDFKAILHNQLRMYIITILITTRIFDLLLSCLCPLPYNTRIQNSLTSAVSLCDLYAIVFMFLNSVFKPHRTSFFLLFPKVNIHFKLFTYLSFCCCIFLLASPIFQQGSFLLQSEEQYSLVFTLVQVFWTYISSIFFFLKIF